MTQQSGLITIVTLPMNGSEGAGDLTVFIM